MNRYGKTKSSRAQPAAAVIAKFGGVRALARDLGVDPASVSRWQSGRNANRGLIPAKYHWSLLALARSRSMSLTADDLVGAP